VILIGGKYLIHIINEIISIEKSLL
jgi:hypothetical protein